MIMLTGDSLDDHGGAWVVADKDVLMEAFRVAFVGGFEVATGASGLTSEQGWQKASEYFARLLDRMGAK